MHPGATDVCDSRDNDCDGTFDEDADVSDQYEDGDAQDGGYVIGPLQSGTTTLETYSFPANDDDFFLFEMSETWWNPMDEVSFDVTLSPPSGVDLDLQIWRKEADGSWTTVSESNAGLEGDQETLSYTGAWYNLDADSGWYAVVVVNWSGESCSSRYWLEIVN